MDGMMMRDSLRKEFFFLGKRKVFDGDGRL